MQWFKLGNWLADDQGIDWRPTGYHIDKREFNRSGPNSEDTYFWLIHLAEKMWLTDMDIYMFNTVFICALEHFKIGLNKNLSLEKSFLEQKKELALNKLNSPPEGVGPE
jgi:hypothetical protein